MNELTPLECSILQFIQSVCTLESNFPTFSRIALYFGLEESAVRRHVSFLQERGYLAVDVTAEPGFRISEAWNPSPEVFEVPMLGQISCGAAVEEMEEFSGCVPVPLEKLGVKPSPYLFAVEARGDSMVGRQIIEGDFVILDKNKVPRSGDVVAALIENESTLKTFISEKGKKFLRPENSKYDNIVPVEEGLIQGVMVLLIRKSV